MTDDPRNPTYDPRITPHHVIYLKGSNSLVKHRFKTIMEQQGISIEEIDNLNEQEGLSLDLEKEIRNRRKANSNTEKKLEVTFQLHARLKFVSLNLIEKCKIVEKKEESSEESYRFENKMEKAA